MRRPTVIAVAAFVVLLLAVLLVERSDMERGTETLDLTTLDPAAVDQIELAEGDTTVELDRTDGVWRLASGRLADRAAVERALEALAEISSSDVVTSSAERHEQYGVGDDAPTVTLHAGGAVAAKLVIGEPARSGGTYVRDAGADTVFRTSQSLRHLLPTDQKRWLQLRLVDAELGDVAQIRVELVGSDPYTIVPGSSDDEWAISNPTQLPADFRFDGPGALRLARTVLNLRAKELVEEPPGDDVTGLAGEHDRLTVSTSGGDATVNLGASNDAGDVWASVDGRDAVFLLPAYQAQNLRKPLADLRDLRLAPFDADHAADLEIVHGSDRFAFHRDPGGDWAVVADAPQPPADLEFDPTAVQRLAVTLGSLRAEALADDVPPARAGLEKPSVVATVTLDDGSTARVAFGRSTTVDDRKFYWADGSADDHVYRVPEYQYTRLTRGWEAFRRVEPPPQQGGNPFANLDPETLKNLPPEVRKSIQQQMEQERRKQELMRQIQQQQGGNG